MKRINGIVIGADKNIKGTATEFPYRVYIAAEPQFALDMDELSLLLEKYLTPNDDGFAFDMSCELSINGVRLRLLSEIDDLPLSAIDNWTMYTFDYVKEV